MSDDEAKPEAHVRENRMLWWVVAAAVLVGAVVLLVLFLSQPSEAPQPRTPDVAGLPLAEARTLLKERGFATVRVVWRSQESGKPGTVVEQVPPAGAVIKSTETTLVVVVARTEGAFPGVVGMKRTDAVDLLHSLGYAGLVYEVSDDTIPIGTVLNQSPDAGTAAPPGATLMIEVSGVLEHGVRVPNVVGLDDITAISVLAEVSLRTVSEYMVSTKYGFVVNQYPVGGMSVAPGSVVRLTVTKKP